MFDVVWLRISQICEWPRKLRAPVAMSGTPMLAMDCRKCNTIIYLCLCGSLPESQQEGREKLDINLDSAVFVFRVKEN